MRVKMQWELANHQSSPDNKLKVLKLRIESVIYRAHFSCSNIINLMINRLTINSCILQS